MQLSTFWIWATIAVAAATAQSIEGITDLVMRRLPEHADSFEFRLVGNATGNATVARPPNDVYGLSSTADGKIMVEGNSLIALASG